MRLWNGWGETDQTLPLNEAARDFLRERIGVATPPRDTGFEAARTAVPASRLPVSALWTDDPEPRLRRAHGHSFPDWIALRSTTLRRCPDAVALPSSHEEAATVLRLAQQAGCIVIPYGGGTSVVGHLTVPDSERPVLSLSLERLKGMLELDARSALARFGAGSAGPQIEAQLRAEGWMLGHFPQSWEFSTIGGWVATRSSGQQSLRYGRIENLFAAGRLLTPRGELRVGGVPASAAGPDLREAVLGSEGRLGLLTEVTARIRRLPEREDFHAVFFPNWELGVEAMRNLAQHDIPLSMLRLSNEAETETQLILAGHDKTIAWLKRYLRLRGTGHKPVMLMIGITGLNREVLRSRREALTLCKQAHGVHAGRMIGEGWAQNRFKAPYLRNSLWELGYAADSVETCVNWPQVTPAMRAIENAATEHFAAQDERVHVFSHLSHVYRQGCSIYSTFVFRSAGTFEANLQRWQGLKARVSETIVAQGGTISHQHGVGSDHAAYLEAEKGPLGLDLIRAMARELDPQGIMNPGKLLA